MLTPSYGITAFPDLLSSAPTVPFNTIYPNPLGSTDNIGKTLAFMGVKYVVYHDDSTNYPSDQILQELLLRDAGYTSARTIHSGFNYFDHLEPYGLKSQVWDRWTTARIADKWVDKAISQNLWLIEVFHAMNLPSYPYSCSESSLKEHLSYIRSRRGEIDNLTVWATIEQIRRKLTRKLPFQATS